MGKSQGTRRKLTLAYRRSEVRGKSPNIRLRQTTVEFFLGISLDESEGQAREIK